MSETAETFTCARCGETHDKGWSDAEAAAEAEGNFPGIDVTDPDEAGVVCDDCYQYIMGRARAEAPELIGPGWRGAPEVLEVLEDGSLLYEMAVPAGSFLAGFGKIRDEAAELGITQEELDREEADMFSTPPGYVPGAGFVSGLAMRMLAESPFPWQVPFRHGNGPPRAAYYRPGSFGECYQTASGMAVHVKPGCRCKR